MNESRKRIQSTLIVDQLYCDIKDRIIRGQLKPDEKLSVRSLCEYYGVSDTPLKQALNRLVAERFVEALPRRGMRVRCITDRDIHETMEARMMMELFAVPFAIEKAQEDPSFLELLEQNLLRNENCLRRGDALGSYSEKAEEELRISQEFHRILVGSTGNSVIMDAYQNLIQHQYVYYQHGKDKSCEVAASLEEHKRIYDCLRAGNEESAREAVVKHLKVREADSCSAIE